MRDLDSIEVSHAYETSSRSKAAEYVLTVVCVALWMGSNLGVLLLNKLLLSYWNFKQPVLLTFLHMVSGCFFIWGIRAVKLLSIQRIQSKKQLLKVFTLSLVFACAVLCANVSLKFLAVSMNQAIGAATPVFTAIFALILQGEKESWTTYSTLLLVVGGVIVASGVEPSLNLFGAAVCFLGAAFRGLRAVMQALLLRPEEKLDSLSCLAYMAPASSVFMLAFCAIVEPASLPMLINVTLKDRGLVIALLLNCLVAFSSNYFNMVVTKRTSALSIQVLGQCKGVMSAVVSVLCFHNVVPAMGWIGYGVTVVGCFLYGRCKTAGAKMKKHNHKQSISDFSRLCVTSSTCSTPREHLVDVEDQIITSGFRTATKCRGAGPHEDMEETNNSIMNKDIDAGARHPPDLQPPHMDIVEEMRRVRSSWIFAMMAQFSPFVLYFSADSVPFKRFHCSRSEHQQSSERFKLVNLYSAASPKDSEEPKTS